MSLAMPSTTETNLFVSLFTLRFIDDVSDIIALN